MQGLLDYKLKILATLEPDADRPRRKLRKEYLIMECETKPALAHFFKHYFTKSAIGFV